jgi:hypothetical protein
MHRAALARRALLAAAAMVPAVLLGAPEASATVASPPGPAVASATPALATPGSTVTFTVSCASLDTPAATLLGQPLGLPALIPLEAAASQGDFVRTLRLAASTKPGRYRPRIDCSDGTWASVALRVESRREAATRAADAASPASAPMSTGLAAAGVALMAVGAVAGGVALGRLRSGYRSRAG